MHLQYKVGNRRTTNKFTIGILKGNKNKQFEKVVKIVIIRKFGTVIFVIKSKLNYNLENKPKLKTLYKTLLFLN